MPDDGRIAASSGNESTKPFGSQEMKTRSLVASTIFLQAVIVLIGIGAFAFMLWEPHVEGRNAHATVFEIYFNDPFLAFAYVASIPFFIALYQAFNVLGYIGQQRTFSQATVKALRTIKLCALTMIGFVVVGEVFIILNETDDRAGGVFMGILIAFCSLVVAAGAELFERIIQNAADMQPANDGPKEKPLSF